MDKPHVVGKTAETDYCKMKSEFPLNLKIKYQWFNVKGRPFS
jgi:hypothetical protein